MNILDFYRDSETRELVKGFLLNNVEKEALRRIYASEDVSGIASAKEIIEKSFEEMERLATPKEKAKKIKNPAR